MTTENIIDQAVKSTQIGENLSEPEQERQKQEKVIFFTVADKNNIDYALKLKNSLKKFHPDIPLKIYGEKDLAKIKDPGKFYRATPLFGRLLLRDYDLVIKIDADSIVLGNLKHVIENQTYDVGAVLNNNGVTPHVTLPGIPPNYYINCGFVAMRSKEFVNTWWDVCNSFIFNGLPYKEQDVLNYMFYTGKWSANNFDATTPYWHGLIANGHRPKFALDKDNQVYVDIPIAENQIMRKYIKVYHAAGGNVVYKQGQKLNFKLYFPPEVAEYMEWLGSDEKSN